MISGFKEKDLLTRKAQCVGANSSSLLYCVLDMYDK